MKLVLVLTVLTLRVTCRKKREAQTQNCAGSQCSQNNLNLSPSPFSPGIGLANPFGLGPFGGFGLGFGGGVRGYGGNHQVQNCVGSQCQQNNHNVQGALGSPGLIQHTQTQNCVGSQCQQNNQNLPAFAFGRRKRSAEDGDKRRNFTVRKIPNGSESQDGGVREKGSAPGGRRKYTRRVVRVEEIPRYQEDHQQEVTLSSLPALLTSDQFLDKVISFRYLDRDTY